MGTAVNARSILKLEVWGRASGNGECGGHGNTVRVGVASSTARLGLVGDLADMERNSLVVGLAGKLGRGVGLSCV